MIELFTALIAVAIIGVGNEVYQDARDRSLARESTRAKLQSWESDRHTDVGDGVHKCEGHDVADLHSDVIGGTRCDARNRGGLDGKTN